MKVEDDDDLSLSVGVKGSNVLGRGYVRSISSYYTVNEGYAANHCGILTGESPRGSVVLK